jgi:hypothetical protein
VLSHPQVSLSEDDRASFGGGIRAVLDDPLLRPRVPAIDDETDHHDEGDHAADHDDERLAGGAHRCVTAHCHGSLSFGCGSRDRDPGWLSAAHGKTRSIGI